MQTNPLHLTAPPDQPYFIWVLAPYLQTEDPNIDYYYDFSQSILEYEKVFQELSLQWKWQPVTLDNYETVIDDIIEQSAGHIPLVLNLCDGDEVNGTPGVSVIHYLKKKKLIYTGADPYFYDITTSKILMKEVFDKEGVPHAAWRPIHHKDQNLKNICKEIGTPLIVKPAVSGGSMGLGTENVIHNSDELNTLVQKLFEGYRGWDFSFGGLVAEQFIKGPEYTVFISGSYSSPRSKKVYMPVERIFHEDLPDTEKFLSFDRLWETYEKEKPAHEEEDFYQYKSAPATIQKSLMDISWKAYCALKGTGYGRVDLRIDQDSGIIYVLEVNAQCGLSEDENFTSIGAIARLGNHPYAEMIGHILKDALQRHRTRKGKTVAIKGGVKAV